MASTHLIPVKCTKINLWSQFVFKLSLFILLIATSFKSYGQLTLNSPNTTGPYIDPNSIVLGVGFSANGTNGTFSAKIDQGYVQKGSSINFISTWNPRLSITTTPALKAVESDNTSVNISTKFFDGLNRAIQTVDKSSTSSGNDFILPFEYDNLSREVKKYLPYSYTGSAPGSYHANANTNEQPAFYNSGSTLVPQSQNPFAKVTTDNSPLDRTTEQGSYGDYWQLSNSGVPNAGHTFKYDYTDNNTTSITDLNNTRIAVYYGVSIDVNGNRTLVVNGGGYYQSDDLFVTIAYDENWTSADGRAGTQETYTDKNGKVVLKRVFAKDNSNNLILLSTYFVYDDYGQLSFVLPPGSAPDILGGSNSVGITTASLNSYCYQYKYDEKLRLVSKKLPGKDWDYLVYNLLNQVVATQDGNQRVRNEWSVKKYDALGRTIITGIWNNNNAAITPDALQVILNSQTVFYESRTSSGNGYTSSSWPQAINTVYRINYYDDYNIPNFPTGYNYQTYSGNPNGYSNQTQGLSTISLTYPLSNTSLSLWTVNYYDLKGRLIQSQATNELSGSDIINNEYGFNGQLSKTNRQHSTSAGSLIIVNRYVYDHHGRLLQHFEQIGSDPEVLLSQLSYNELGQLINKKLHLKSGNTKFIQSEDFRYNIRGWLTSVNDPSLAANLTTNPDNAGTSDVDKFGASFTYESGTIPQYNGNISSKQWAIAAPSGISITSPLLKYDFRYDKLNRLKEAVSSTGSTKDGNFSEYLSYDNMGNITSLGRWAKLAAGKTQIDSLSYQYSGNQATEIDDISGNNIYGFTEKPAGTVVRQANEYGYDANGNVTQDLNKGISIITYNNFNLPVTITWTNGNALTYEYDGSGNKLKKVFTAGGTTSTTYYIAGIQYVQGQIDFVTTDEGLARKNPSGSNYIYQYILGDQLGSNYAVIQPVSPSETTADVLQLTNYYPFGLDYKSDDPNQLFSYLTGTKDNYLFNGEEMQDGVNDYDYGARQYDPATGRWSVIDRLAEHPDQIDKSPYAYVWNNPELHNDPNGDCPVCAIVGAVVGGLGNLAVQAAEGHVTSIGKGLAAFGIGAVAGAVAGLTMGATLVAGTSTLAVIANATAVGAYAGGTSSLIQGIGNQVVFGDPYGPSQFAQGIVFGGVTGGIAQGIELELFGNDPSVIIPGGLKSGSPTAEELKESIDMSNATWAQTDFSETFSKDAETPALFRGKSINDIASGLKDGSIPTSKVSVQVIVKEGRTYIINTRSSVALLRAGIPMSEWTIIDVSNSPQFLQTLANRLIRNNLSAEGTRQIYSRVTKEVINLP